MPRLCSMQLTGKCSLTWTVFQSCSRASMSSERNPSSSHQISAWLCLMFARLLLRSPQYFAHNAFFNKRAEHELFSVCQFSSFEQASESPLLWSASKRRYLTQQRKWLFAFSLKAISTMTWKSHSTSLLTSISSSFPSLALDCHRRMCFEASIKIARRFRLWRHTIQYSRFSWIAWFITSCIAPPPLFKAIGSSRFGLCQTIAQRHNVTQEVNNGHLGFDCAHGATLASNSLTCLGDRLHYWRCCAGKRRQSAGLTNDAGRGTTKGIIGEECVRRRCRPAVEKGWRSKREGGKQGVSSISPRSRKN